MNIFEFAVVREAGQLAAEIQRDGAAQVLARLHRESRGRDLLLLLGSAQAIAEKCGAEPGFKAGVDVFVRADLALRAAGVTTDQPERKRGVLVWRGRRKAQQKRENPFNALELRAGGL